MLVSPRAVRTLLWCECSGGVRPGDVITAINGNAVTSSADVYKAVNSGNSLQLTVLRTDSPAAISLTVSPETVQ